MAIPANIRIYLIFPETWSTVFAADSMGLSSFKFVQLARNTHFFYKSAYIGRSRSSKVTDFGTNRKRVCNFLLVRHTVVNRQARGYLNN